MKVSDSGTVHLHNGGWQGHLRIDGVQHTKTFHEYVDPKGVKRKIPCDGKTSKGSRLAQVALDQWRESLLAEEAARVAEEAAKAADAVRVDSLTVNGGDKTVGQYVIDYIDLMSKVGGKKGDGLEASTVDGYKFSAQHIKRGFEGVAMRDLTTQMVENWLVTMKDEGCGGSTRAKAARILMQACDYAVQPSHRALESNPFAGISKRQRPKPNDPDPNPLDDASLSKVNAWLDVEKPNDFVTAVALALHAGMRVGEVCALRWSSVSFDGDENYPTGYIHVEATIARTSTGTYRKPPKTAAGDRKIPLNDFLRTMLERRRAVMEGALEGSGTKLDPSAYVIGDVAGGYANPTVISREWKSNAKLNSLMGTKGRVPTFHDLRHTTATRLIGAGVDTKTVAGILGHANEYMTLHVYADFMPDVAVKAMGVAQGALDPRRAGDVEESNEGGAAE